jgi:hypothetical protein
MLTSLALLIWYGKRRIIIKEGKKKKGGKTNTFLFRYFPLWNMGISGYEAFLLITLMPCVLGMKGLRRFIARNRSVFHMLSLIGVASYLKTSPVWRLIATALGIGTSLTTWVATWIESKNQTGDLERSALIWGLGLILHNIVKMAWFTENPIWPIMNKDNGGWNSVGIVLGIIASVEVYLRDAKSHATDNAGKNLTGPVAETKAGSSFMAAAGFGALLFALHSMFTDSSTIMRWSVDGYPSFGPDPVPWGVATIGALALGLLISPNRRLTTSIAWYAVGCGACAVFYISAGWYAFYGGLVLGGYFVSVMPAFIRGISTQSPFVTLFMSFMIYNILCLAHVWVVAYEFVPGGVYAREHTDYVLITLMTLTGCGVWNANKQASVDVRRKMAQFHLLRHARTITRLMLVGLMILSGLVSFKRIAGSKSVAPYTTSEKSFTAGIWTIHFALDNEMWASENRIRDAIRDLQLDVVGKELSSRIWKTHRSFFFFTIINFNFGFLVSDTMRIIMGNRDWAQSIAEELGYYLDFVS